MLRVLYIAPDIDGGGVGGVVYNYISHMNRESMKIEIISKNYGYNQFLHDKLVDCGVTIHYVTQRRLDIIKHFKEVTKIIKDGDFNVVHCHDQNWSVFYLLIALRYGVKVRIAHSHLTMQNHDRAKIMILNLFNPLLKAVATSYFACGKEAGEYMWGKRIANSSKLYVMNNAVDINDFKFDENVRNQYRKELGLEGKTVIGHVGRFSDQKNHVFLVDIFDEYLKVNPDALLIVVGKGELEEQVREKICSSKLEDKVMMLGLRDDVPKLMNCFDIFLLPSLYEGLPVVGIEAQANGLPCLFSDKITKETKLLDTTELISIQENPTVWAEKIKEHLIQKNVREEAFDIVSDAGFNISEEANSLKSYYHEQKDR